MPLPPGPRTSSPLGFLRPFRQDVIAFLTRVAEEYGDVAYFKAGAMKCVLLNAPPLVQEVLVTRQHGFARGRPLEFTRRVLGDGLLTTDGAVHARQRRIAQPAFHADKIRRYTAAMTDYASRLRESWHEGDVVDVASAMRRLTLGISARTLLDVELDAAKAAAIDEAVSSAMQYFDRVSIPFVELFFGLPLPSTIRVRRARKMLTSTIRAMIDDRRGDDVAHDDFLSMLLRARQPDGTALSDEEICDQALVFLLAAYDTTASGLAWMWYLLSQNPACEAALQRELHDVLDGRLPAADDLPRLTYTRGVFAESLRLFPPAYVIARRALQAFEIGGFEIPRGTTILVSPYLLQRDRRFYESPELFDPTRWERRPYHNPFDFTFFPFGGGAHVCIGDHFAWTEAMIVLATLAQRWKLTLAADQVVARLPLVNLRPRFGMRMVVKPPDTPRTKDRQARLIACFRRVFPTLPEATLKAASMKTIGTWDSAALLLLLATVEKEFHVQLDPMQVNQFTSFTSILALLDSLDTRESRDVSGPAA